MPFNTSRRCVSSSSLHQTQALSFHTAGSHASIKAQYIIPRPSTQYVRSVTGFPGERSNATRVRSTVTTSLRHSPSYQALGYDAVRHRSLVAIFRSAPPRHVRFSSSEATDFLPDHEIRARAKYRLTTQELKNLVDIYSWDDESTEISHEQSLFRTRPEKPIEDEEAANHTPQDASDRATLNTLDELLDDEESSHQQIYDAYRSLSEPRAKNLPRETLDGLLNHLSVVEYSTEASMLRYLSVVEDVKSAGRKIRLHHWNSVINLTATCVKKISQHEVESALDIWREMEHQAGVQANHVTFNILFDIATKAGKFLLADMIYDEMKTRGLEYTRYFRTSLIYHQGLRRDGDGVRKAYADLVDAGEIVDTTVINCVIAALLHCGEASAAEQTFERAKQLHASKTNQQLPPSHWRARRKLGRHLERAAKFKRVQTSGRKSMQILEGPFSSNVTSTIPETHVNSSSTPHDDVIGALTGEDVISQEDTSIAPDLQTFKVLIYYHSIAVGDIDRVANLVDEMEHYDVALHGSVFLHLFKAFGVHGGVLYTQWTLRRLENTWSSYIKAVDADGGAGLVYTSRAAGMIAAKAYLQCAGPGRAAEIWIEARSRIRDVTEEQLEDYDHDVAEIMDENVGLFWDVLDWKMSEMSARQRDEPVSSTIENSSSDEDILVQKSSSEDNTTKANI